MFGTILNAAGILLGGILGLAMSGQMSHRRQLAIKGLLGVFTVYVGLKMTWMSLGGGLGSVARELTIILLALFLGRAVGRLLHIQKGLNRLGQYAKQKLSQIPPDAEGRFSEGFVTCTILFCVGPIAILGSIQDGLEGKWQTLGIKAVMDGLATMAFVSTLGWGAILSVVPVVAYQGTLTLCARLVAPFLQDHALIDSINATGGLLVFCIALIILEFKKIELADYLPSLIVAPVLTWFWK